MSPRAYIGFGANLGDRKKTFQAVLAELGAVSGLEVESISSLYETEPQGVTDGGPAFLNAAIAVTASLSAEDLIGQLRRIEQVLGKSPSHRSDMSRMVDLDLLLYGDSVIKTHSLEIPHPRMHERGFVLIPLRDIAANVVHPVLDRTVTEMVRDLSSVQVDSVLRALEAP